MYYYVAGYRMRAKTEKDDCSITRSLVPSPTSDGDFRRVIHAHCTLFTVFLFFLRLTTRRERNKLHPVDGQIVACALNLALSARDLIVISMATFIRRARFPIRRRYSEFLFSSMFSRWWATSLSLSLFLSALGRWFFAPVLVKNCRVPRICFCSRFVDYPRE